MAEKAAPTTLAKPQRTAQYEAMFLLPAAAATDQQAALGLVRGVIERHGGQILVLKRWDERKLAYEINGQKRGTYVIAYFRSPGAIVSAIERDVKLSDDFLRVMITKADHLSQPEMEAVEPQPIVREERPSWERDDRGGGYRGGGGGFRDRDRDDRGPREDRGPRDDRGGEGGGGGGGDRPAGGGDRPPRAPRARREDGGPAAPAPAEAGADKA